MDLLSDVISVSRLGKPHSARVRRCRPFHRKVTQSDSAGFHVVLRGTCWVVTPGFDPAQLGPGDVVFFPRGSAHALIDRPPLVSVDGGESLSSDIQIEQVDLTGSADFEDESSADVVMLCGAYLLDRLCLHPLLDELPEMLHFRAEAGTQWQLRTTLELLGAEVDWGQSGADAALCALLDLMFLYILRTWLADSFTHAHPTGWSAALKDPRIAAALSGIHREPGKRWTVAALAHAAGLSRAAFARRFSALLGQAPAAYLTLWRMIFAIRLMRDSDQSLAEIALQVGYSSEYAFAHAFKRLHSISPGAYRRGLKKPGLSSPPIGRALPPAQ
ncbi:AraC family transcriptional regulator [Rhizobium sp. AB2/73]|uniref:AraC family transcriptional regulator n=1 Tax=Rhizobium sp. AB2/73 TaxID=2795216 RepID=UPI001C5D625E|nr:AraC family transcriptional regulator [Rhizobium sp. AB2/73]UEQ82133.1 AraC family transcriptional regulator [Rhizobium sp. AB2/73]